MENRRLTQLTGIAGGLLVLGSIAWLTSIAVGKPAWGILLTNFIYFASITQGALAIAIVLRITSAKWSAHFYRLAAAAALSFFPIGLALLAIIIIVKNYIFYWAEEAEHSLWYNSSFFIIRNLLPFIIFYLLARRLFRISNTSGAAQKKESESSIFRHAEQPEHLPKSFFNNELLITGFFLLLSFVVFETIMSWDLGMLLNKHFADTVYSVIFIIGSVLGGVALLVLLMIGAKRYLGSKAFGPAQFESLAQIMLALSIFWFYVWYTQFFSIWFVNLPEETEPIYLRIFHGYGNIFFPSIILITVIPFIFLIFKKVRDSERGIAAIAASILLGLWLDRYLIIIPSLVKEHKIAETSLFNPINILFSLGILGGVVLVLTMILRSNPKIIPAELEEVAKDPLITEPTGWQ